jgi:hypothetical protein
MALEKKHQPLEFEGTPRQCGKAYGESEREAIQAFLAKEIFFNPQRLRYAQRCWKVLQGWEKPIAEFVYGMAQGAGLEAHVMTLLLLHEEVVHMEHCTAFGATGAGTKDGKALVAQNWDWNSHLYPWSGMLRLQTTTMPATVTYTFPGLWASAGINEHGLSLVWTGAGYTPKIAPRTGIPTYALIAGILTRRSAREAIELIKNSPLAGHFIFLIADAGGEVLLVEAVAGQVAVEKCQDVIGRANHFECPAICKASRQQLPPVTPRLNSPPRRERLTELLSKYHGRIDAAVAQKVLRDHGAPGTKPGYTICQHPVGDSPGMTIDSFYMLPAKREFWIARGYACRHDYECHSVA